jgi:hypothetical protein
LAGNEPPKERDVHNPRVVGLIRLDEASDQAEFAEREGIHLSIDARG